MSIYLKDFTFPTDESETRFNFGRFFSDYLEMCNYNLKRNTKNK